jgi:predicted XRE-type DNA-binding protein
MAKKPLIPVTPSSGNVFADIGVPEPEEELAKAQLASRIREIVRGSRLTQVAAAAVMGIDQPKVSALLGGRLTNFSSERLMRLLTRLGQDVEIVGGTRRSLPRPRRTAPSPFAHGRRRAALAGHP